MKKESIERSISAARPDTHVSNTQFTDAVMKKVKKNEIIAPVIRTMNVTNKETFIMKLKHLPKFAVFAIAVGALVILSGTAYATYQLLWAKPSVELHQLTTSTSGREEAVLSTKECGPSLAQQYELKKGATITADRIPAIVQAQCELKAIGTWAQSTYGGAYTQPPKDGSSFEQTSARVSMATHLESQQKDTLTFAAIEKYGMPAQSFARSTAIKYIVDGKEVSAAAVQPGDAVVYVVTDKMRMTPTKEGGYSGGGMPAQTLVAVVKLSMPFEDYDQFAWQSLAERQTCYGNPEDTCLTGGASIDLYMGSGANIPQGKMIKQIQGIVTALNGKTVSIKSSSGRIFEVSTPTDVIKTYNDTKATQYYNNQKVSLGSSIDVQYYETENEHSTTINAFDMRFMIELVSKGDPIKAY